MPKENLEVGDIVMCTVERIAGTVVFVKIDGAGQGGIILSEIAPGRIRNLRDYVVPKKKIICKVLRIVDDRIDLSLRRVTPKEQKEIREEYKLEKSYTQILKTILKEKAPEIIKKILEKEKIYYFLEEAKEKATKLEKLVGKTDATKILEILNTQKQKSYTLKKEFALTSTASNGLELIKKILGKIKNSQVKYISAGKYTLQTESDEPKTTGNNLKEAFKTIEKQVKNDCLEFSIKEK